MAAYLLTASLIIGEYIIYWSGNMTTYSFAANINFPLHFLFGPLLHLYVIHFIRQETNFTKHLMHFAPFIVVAIIMLPYYFALPILKLSHPDQIPYLINIRYVPAATVLHMFFYVVIMLYYLYKEKNVGHITKWLYCMVIMLGLYMLCYAAYYLFVNEPWFTLKDDYFISAISCLSITIIIYLSYSRKKIFEGYNLNETASVPNFVYAYKENLKELLAPTQLVTYDYRAYDHTPHLVQQENNFPENKLNVELKYKNSSLDSELIFEIGQLLDTVMTTKFLYRQSDIKLESLADAVGVTRHHLSQVINTLHSVNFFEYINILRINEAKQLIVASSKSGQPIIDIAYQVGYNNKNTFNNAFKRLAGCTPSEFRNSNTR